MEWLRRKISLLWPRNLPDEPYIKYQFDNFRLIGIYPGFSKSPYWQRLGFYAIELFCVLQTAAVGCDLVDPREDIERFGDDICILTSCTMVLLKRWFCRFYVADLFEFVEQYRIGLELYRYREPPFIREILSHHRLETLFAYATRILSIVLITSLMFYGLLSNTFILRAQFPFNTDTFIGYGAVYLSQALFVSYGISSVVILDLFCIQVISQLSLHFQLLSMDFAILGTELLVNGPESRSETVDTRIRQLSLRHQYLLDLGNQVKELLESNIMGQFVASIFLICMSAFEVLVAKGNVMLIIRFGTFALCVFFQIFMWSLFGNLIAQKSLGISDGIARCNWIVLDRKQKKDLSFIMMRAQKPFIISVYRMFPLTYETFLAILGRSYSIFTILREMIE